MASDSWRSERKPCKPALPATCLDVNVNNKTRNHLYCPLHRLSPLAFPAHNGTVSFPLKLLHAKAPTPPTPAPAEGMGNPGPLVHQPQVWHWRDLNPYPSQCLLDSSLLEPLRRPLLLLHRTPPPAAGMSNADTPLPFVSDSQLDSVLFTPTCIPAGIPCCQLTGNTPAAYF